LQPAHIAFIMMGMKIVVQILVMIAALGALSAQDLKLLIPNAGDGNVWVAPWIPTCARMLPACAHAAG
jgi:hypothetical protein